MMRMPFVLVLLLAACSAAPPPAPAPTPAPIAEAAPQPPGYLGFGFTYQKPDPARQTSGWLMVLHVPDDGPAYRAGVKPQTVITAIDGKPLDFPSDDGVLSILKSIRPGDNVRLTLAGHEPREVVLVAAEMPPDKLRIWKANFDPAPKQ